MSITLQLKPRNRKLQLRKTEGKSKGYTKPSSSSPPGTWPSASLSFRSITPSRLHLRRHHLSSSSVLVLVVVAAEVSSAQDVREQFANLKSL